MKTIKEGGNPLAAYSQLEGPELTSLLRHLGQWQEGAMAPDRFLYILQRAVLGGGEMLLSPREAWLESHLARAGVISEQLEEFLNQILIYLEKELPRALQREVLAWLPNPVEPAPDVAILLGTPWLMYTDDIIYLDLLGLAEVGKERAEQFICHEVFHHCHRRLAMGASPLLPWLFELQSEGVVGHIVGGSRELWEACHRHAPGEFAGSILTRLEWYPRFNSSPDQYMEELWQILAEGMGGKRDRLAHWYRERFPGHHQGVLMAKVIEQELGREELVGSLLRPEDFPALFNKASLKGNLPKPPTELLSALAQNN
jgi:hypothetical protein